MKKLLLVISLIIPLLFSHVNVSKIKAEDDLISEDCDSDNSIVRIIDNYNVFKSNGFVYKVDNNYSYIITTSKIINSVNSYGIIYENNIYEEAVLLGYDSYNEVAVFRTKKIIDIKGVCLANSNYLYKGQLNYLQGYLDLESRFTNKVNLSQIGELYSNSDYKNIFKNTIQINGNNNFNGTPVFDELNRLVGMVSGHNSAMIGISYIVESNKLVKIADSIVKTGNYDINYIKYSLVDYGTLSSRLKESYGVSSKVNSGVVIVTFKPFNYIFGGLNQGMTIVAVNGIDVKNVYEFDKQISRYEKKSSVCIKVIKTNGKTDYYYVKL